MITRGPFRYLVVSLVIAGGVGTPKGPLAVSALGQPARSATVRVSPRFSSPAVGYTYYTSVAVPPMGCVVLPWGVYCGPYGPYSYNPYDYGPYSYRPYSFYGPYSYLPYGYGPYGYGPYSYSPYSYWPYFYGPPSGIGCPPTVPPSACLWG